MTRYLLSALGCGVLFGAGLAMSGMTDPRVVLGFLDVFGAFNPTLLFVLGGAVATTMLTFRLILRRRPVLAPAFRLSALVRVDRRLLVGAGLFGVGWGIAGYCPGPAVSGLGIGSREALWFVPAMLVGMGLYELVARLMRAHVAARNAATSTPDALRR
ncbi:MAG TPA: DUF6691 family protein [Rhodanobacteraceae bacterium]